MAKLGGGLDFFVGRLRRAQPPTLKNAPSQQAPSGNTGEFQVNIDRAWPVVSVLLAVSPLVTPTGSYPHPHAFMQPMEVTTARTHIRSAGYEADIYVAGVAWAAGWAAVVVFAQPRPQVAVLWYKTTHLLARGMENCSFMV